VDDRNSIFRRGLRACLVAEGFVVAGESLELWPQPDPARFDILVFALDPAGLQRAVRLTHGTSVRLIGIADEAEEGVLFDAVEAGLAGFLLRAELTPDGLAGCVQSVSGGNGALPPGLLAKLLAGLARGATRGASAAQLARRELSVLRLLAEGGDTREIAAELSYSERTVKNIVHDVLVKMNCRTRAHAVALATRQGFI
jgi:DNA-binding NarL/FixJ family response regulator